MHLFGTNIAAWKNINLRAYIFAWKICVNASSLVRFVFKSNLEIFENSSCDFASEVKTL